MRSVAEFIELRRTFHRIDAPAGRIGKGFRIDAVNFPARSLPALGNRSEAGRGKILRAFALRRNACLPRFTIFKRIVVLFAPESGEIRPEGSTLGVRPKEVPLADAPARSFCSRFYLSPTGS